MKLRHVKISRLLTAGCLLLIALICAVALHAALIAKDANSALQTLYQQRLVPLEHQKKLADLYADVLFKANQIALGRGEPEQARKEVQTALDQINQHWQALNSDSTQEKDRQALQAATAVAQKAQPAINELLDALAKKDRMRTSLVALDLTDLVNVVAKQINILEQLQLDHSSAEFQEANARYQQSASTFGLAVAAVIAGAALAAWYLIGLITMPIRQAVAIAKRVATGNMNEPIVYEGNSEMADMLHALQDMQHSLGQVVTEVRSSAETLAQTSGEIAQGNQALSVRTENQASTIEKTASSMDQLSHAVHHNADSAKEANALAHNASAVARKGGDVVGQVVATMRGINESSRKISDIISVIDGIAFQTNILALNAAVEAARAGEQGRGFAVVASEVRTLAGRSADAAKEIKSLINASVERVEQGSLLVDEAGTTMNEVLAAIEKVTDLMGEISTASHQQAAGVAQIGSAVSQMDQATQQNAAQVDQMAAAAAKLRAQAQDLVRVVARFKLQNSEAYSALPPAVARPALTPAALPPAAPRHAPPLSPKAAAKPVPKAVVPPSRPSRPSALPSPTPVAKAAPAAKPASTASEDDWETF